MKTQRIIYLLFLLLLINVSSYSQEHLKFKNIPIDGNIDDFASELIKQGFSKSEEESIKNIIILNGEFINKKNCEIYIIGTKKSYLTWRINIILPKEISWISLKESYFEIKKQYQSKYGSGESFEYFSEPYFEGDGYELQALRKEKCTYSSYWKLESGIISLKISTSDSNSISIAYQDTQNSDIMRKEKEAIIESDI